MRVLCRYTYNDAESVAIKSPALSHGGVDVLHANHHGSGHSSNSAYINTLAAQASVISCGYANTHGEDHNKAFSLAQS